ncbi:protein disulfide isomerase-like 5-2 [Magnolia sinica]|uniref:protein disulfide isomerase-like 5-2 n=1 Tax=Magnolia sinica TaxID=86752 RepID=UPI00265B53EF|nr:protein disulfide isomerase-like 5-2 [Magnolia sinica]
MYETGRSRRMCRSRAMPETAQMFRRTLLLLPIFLAALIAPCVSAVDEFTVDGTVLELDGSNFDSAISTFDFILVDFYAPWCGHCKRLSPELDVAAPLLAVLDKPIMIAKVNADKFTHLGSKYEVDGYPTLKLFMHGVPVEYSGPRKAELLVKYLKKFVGPDVSLLESDSAISSFIETAGTQFPIFIGFGLNEALIVDFAKKYKKKAWFSVAKDFSEDIMVVYDFDKVPALVCFHPSYDEKSIFYGPFEAEFLEDFIKQNQLPLVLPVNYDTLKLLKDDERKVVLTIMEDESDVKSHTLIKTLKAAASANRDLIFGYAGFKEWEDFVDVFDVDKKTKLPKMVVWDRNDEFSTVVGLESIDEEDQRSQISQFLEGYREGRTIQKRFSGPSLIGYINSLISIRTVYLIVFVVAVIMLIRTIGNKDEDDTPRTHRQVRDEDTSSSSGESERREYQPGDKED